MKKWAAFLFICYLTSSFSKTNISPQFSELNGIEDQLGNTHLFYRIYEYISNEYGFYQGNSIYHFDLAYGIDTLFINDFINDYPAYQMFKVVEDYEFWNNDYSKFIYVGSEGGFEVFPYIRRFDEQYINLNYLCCSINNIDISNVDDSLLYAGGFIPWEGTIKSNDGGFHWNPLNDSLIFLSLNPYDNNILFFENSFGFLYRSTDAGNTTNLVDVLNQPSHSTSFIYDPDQLHMYRLFSNQTLRISPNNGEPFSWQTKYSSDTEIFISNDESISGTIYLADKKNIFVSTDYGNNFTLYKSLDRRIVGIYKKPNSNKLYAATKYRIYEITPDTIQTIKSLPIPEEVLNYYPLAVGNKWIYDAYHFNNGNTYQDLSVTEVNGIYLQPNGKLYYILRRYHLSQPGEGISYERVDSSSAKIYKYDENLGLPNDEYIIDDLLAEPGDTVLTYRFYLPGSSFTIVIKDTLFEKWELTKTKRVFQEIGSGIPKPTYSLTQDIGLDSMFFVWDDNINDTYILKGCIIDGVIYGDTTTVGVEDEQNPIPTEFKLEQNYPNPFNPSTKIKYYIPSVGTRDRVSVQIIVYDVLGNEISTLVNEEKPAGEYEIAFDGTGIPSGIYFYQLRASNLVQTKKMILLK
jgi:hypothetical protein